jgi:hypothetical protein
MICHTSTMLEFDFAIERIIAHLLKHGGAVLHRFVVGLAAFRTARTCVCFESRFGITARTERRRNTGTQFARLITSSSDTFRTTRIENIYILNTKGRQTNKRIWQRRADMYRSWTKRESERRQRQRQRQASPHSTRWRACAASAASARAASSSPPVSQRSCRTRCSAKVCMSANPW